MPWRQYKSSAITMPSASTFLEGTWHKLVFNTCNLIQCSNKWNYISLALSLVMPWPENSNTMPSTHYPHPHADLQWWIKMSLVSKRKDSPARWCHLHVEKQYECKYFVCSKTIAAVYTGIVRFQSPTGWYLADTLSHTIYQPLTYEIARDLSCHFVS